MKRLLILFVLFIVVITVPSIVLAQGMMGNWIGSSSGQVADDHTAREEKEGGKIWDALQVKQTECKNLSDDNYEALGEYFMGLSIGNTERHAAMNRIMTNMMGEQGEEQMHIALGKRSSGCDTNAPLPSGYNMLPMMWMMGGGGNSMMNFGFIPFGGLGWIFMILWWVLIIAGIVALIKWLTGQSRGMHGQEKSPLEILKGRYAKGEIDKKEFEDKKKDLTH